MNIYPKVKRFVLEHYVDGKWSGAHVKDKPVMTIDGVQYALEDVLKAMDYPVKTKYKEDKQNEDVAESHADGNNPIVGNGVSESEE